MHFSVPRFGLLLFFLVVGLAMRRHVSSYRARLLVNRGWSTAGLPAGIRVLIRGNHLTYRQVVPDSGGRFSFDFPDSRDSAGDLFCVAPGLDTLFLKTVSGKAADTSEQILLFPCQPDSNAAGDIVCPRCRKEDQVYPVTYGEPIVITRHYDTAGKMSYEKNPGPSTSPDSIVRAARFYCRRDKINF